MFSISVIEAFRQSGLEIVDEGEGHFRVMNNTKPVDIDLILEKEPHLTLICAETFSRVNNKQLFRVFYGILN